MTMAHRASSFPDGPEIVEKIKKLKHQPFGDVAVPCAFRGLNYRLVLLTEECAQDDQMMGFLAAWREENEEWFPTQFKITLEGTRKWFREGLIEVRDRLLFVIEVGERMIGHVGMFRFDFKTMNCEIDNIVRGEQGYPGIMGDACLQMMSWGVKVFGVKIYTLKVRHSNDKAVRLYKRIGFVETKRVPLIPGPGGKGARWVPAPEGYPKEIERYSLEMAFEGNPEERLK